MAKYVEYQYGDERVADTYVAFMVLGRKVVKVTKLTGKLPVMEETEMTLEQYRDIPLPEDWL